MLGPSWALLGPSWRLLGPSWSLLGASCGRLEAILDVLRRKTVKLQKPIKAYGFWWFGGFRGGAEAKLGLVGAKLGHVEPKWGSSWLLEAILPPSCRHLAILRRLRAVLEATWRQLEPS